MAEQAAAGTRAVRRRLRGKQPLQDSSALLVRLLGIPLIAEFLGLWLFRALPLSRRCLQLLNTDSYVWAAVFLHQVDVDTPDQAAAVFGRIPAALSGLELTFFEPPPRRGRHGGPPDREAAYRTARRFHVSEVRPLAQRLPRGLRRLALDGELMFTSAFLLALRAGMADLRALSIGGEFAKDALCALGRALPVGLEELAVCLTTMPHANRAHQVTFLVSNLPPCLRKLELLFGVFAPKSFLEILGERLQALPRLERLVLDIMDSEYDHRALDCFLQRLAEGPRLRHLDLQLGCRQWPQSTSELFGASLRSMSEALQESGPPPCRPVQRLDVPVGPRMRLGQTDGIVARGCFRFCLERFHLG